MNRPLRDLSRALVVIVGLLGFYVVVLFTAQHEADRNQRRENVFVWGSAIAHDAGARAPVGESLLISPLAPSVVSSTTWNVYPYELSHLLNRARACAVRIVFPGLALSSASPGAGVDILFDGALVRHVRFSTAQRGFYPSTAGRYVPEDVVPQLIDVVALDRRYGFVFPLPPRSCASREWTVEIRSHDATWQIPFVGLSLSYTPAPVPLFGSAFITIVAGAAVVIAMLALLVFVVQRYSSLGLAPLCAAAGVLALATLTHDQWDFPLWIRFSELASFGGANAANLWSASPLWAFVPSLFSTVTLASYVATGDGSRTITELLLKIGIALAYCFNGYAIACRAPLRLRPFYALTAVLLPSGLYEVAAGYREPIAGALVFIGLALAQRRNLILATVLLCAGASVSETLLPLVLLPAALAFADRPGRAHRARDALALAAFGTALFLAEWASLFGRETAKTALAWRFGVAHLGGASWAGGLDGLGLLPAWLPAGSPAFGIFVFAACALLPALRLLRCLRSDERTLERTFDVILAPFVGLVAAFFIAFRGVDANMWYALIVITLYHFARTDPGNPYPLILSFIVSLTMYGAVGFGDFVNQSVLWPYDRSLLGILGVSRFVFDIMLSGLASCLLIAVSADATSLFSKHSPWFLALFCAAVATTAIRAYPLDGMMCAAAVAIVFVTFCRQVRHRRQRGDGLRRPLMRGGILATIATFGALCGARATAAGVAALGALLTTLTSGCGSCDLVLALGAIGVLAAQTGFGWTSLAGWVLLSIVASVAIVRTFFDAREVKPKVR